MSGGGERGRDMASSSIPLLLLYDDDGWIRGLVGYEANRILPQLLPLPLHSTRTPQMGHRWATVATTNGTKWHNGTMEAESDSGSPEPHKCSVTSRMYVRMCVRPCPKGKYLGLNLEARGDRRPTCRRGRKGSGKVDGFRCVRLHVRCPSLSLSPSLCVPFLPWPSCLHFSMNSSPCLHG